LAIFEVSQFSQQVFQRGIGEGKEFIQKGAKEGQDILRGGVIQRMGGNSKKG